MSALRSGELFAGVGGLGMAVDEVFGSSPAWFCEFDKAPSKVLAHRHPNVPNLGDVTKVDWEMVKLHAAEAAEEVRPKESPAVNVLAGGFP